MKKLTNLLVILLIADLQVSFSQKAFTIPVQENDSTLKILPGILPQLINKNFITPLGIEKESRSAGYSITDVNKDLLLEGKSTNMMEFLEGEIPGLNITIPSSGMGGSSQIRLRGQAGFAGANNAPIIIINGLPLNQDARGANGDNMRDLGDNLNGINPEDIGTMTVLKGAAASAIYGSRAANGAIIITTKSGYRNQGIGLEFSSGYSAQAPLNYWNLQQVYGQGRNGQKPASQAEAIATGQYGWGSMMDGSLVPIFNGTMRPYSPNLDNLFNYYRTGQVLTNTLALSGGNERGSFRASFSNTGASGIDPFNKYGRNIGNFGFNFNITNDVLFTVNINYSGEKYINPPELGQQGPGAVNFFTRLSTSIPFDALKNSATNPVTGTEAQTSGFQSSILNPFYAYQDAGQRFDSKRDRYLETATLRYDVTDWLFVQARINYNHLLAFTQSKVPGGIGTNQPMNTADGSYKGSYSINKENGAELNADFILGGRKRFDKLTVNTYLGGNTYRVKNQFSGYTVTNFIVKDLFSMQNGTNRVSIGSIESHVNSVYGLAEIGYNSILYLDFTGRNDWFSNFNPANNSKFYPSVSGSFVFSELLKNFKWLDYARLRGSWAQVGPGIVTENEAGLEVMLFKNKLHFDVAVFSKVSDDQEISVLVSGSSGYNSTVQNIGSFKNQGIEFLLEFKPVETNIFSWTTSWNNSFLKTEVLSLGNEPDGTPINDYRVVNFNETGNEFLGELHYTVGMPMNMLYTRTYLRNENGDILLRDNGRLIASPDYVPVGSSIPKNTGGWANTFVYKNLTLRLLLDYKLGGTVLSGTYLNMTRQGFSQLSLEGRKNGQSGLVFPGVYQSNGLPNTTPVTDLQSFYGEYRTLQIGDPFTFRSDFLKLRYISVSYNITNTLKSLDFMKFVKSLTLTGTVRNVAILYKDIPDIDPEAIQSSGDFRAGYENAALPTTRNFMFTLFARF